MLGALSPLASLCLAQPPPNRAARMSIATAVDAFLDDTPPPHPVATPEQQALLDWAAAHPTGRYEAPKPNGRYKLPNPDTGKPQTWTRATTLASTIDDESGLTVWRHRLLVAGMTAPGLADQAAAAQADGDKKALGQIAGRALHHAGEKLAADIGTALHLASEHADLGTDEWPPTPWGADVAAYDNTLTRAGIVRPAEWVERVALNPAAGAAGTIDRIVTGPWGPAPRIADLKTGSGHDRLSYAVQLAIYARSTHLLATDGQTWEPMPPVDLETALIFHLPAGSATCEIIEVDIAKGWELVQLCLAVREARKTKALFRPHVAAQPAPSRTDWIVGRIRAVRDCGDPKGRDALAAFWPAGITRNPADWTPTDLDAIHEVLHAIEVLDAVPFPPPDPTKPTPDQQIATEQASRLADRVAVEQANPITAPIVDDGFIADENTRAEVKLLVTYMDEPAKRVAAWWERTARDAGKPWTFGNKPTDRIAAINAAAFACATHLTDGPHDDAVRCAIEWATGWTLNPTWGTGPLLGSLDHTQALWLRNYAERVANNDAEIVADLADRLAHKFSTTPANQADQPAQEQTNP